MKAKNWYDSITPEQIQQLQLLVKPLGLLPLWMDHALRAANTEGHIEEYLSRGWKLGSWASLMPSSTYRLRHDWVRPSTAEKLVSYEVKTSCEGEHHFEKQFSRSLHSACAYKGYCGIEYAEIPGIFASAPNVFKEILTGLVFPVTCIEDYTDDKDYQRIWPTPVRVWFREV